MKGNVLNERMRFDVSALFPELTNNGVRLGRWEQSGGKCSHGDYNIPDGNGLILASRLLKTPIP